MSVENGPTSYDTEGLNTTDSDYTAWRKEYPKPSRECPDCENDKVLSKKETKLVLGLTVGVPYICEKCHLRDW